MTANRNTKTPRSKSAKKGPRSRLTDEQIGKLYEGGASPKQISTRAGISEKAVRRHIRTTGRTLRPRSPWTTEQLADLYFGRQPDQSQHSLQEIQDVTGIRVSTVSVRLRRAKYKLRGRGAQPGRLKKPEVKTDAITRAFDEMLEAGKKPVLTVIAKLTKTTRPTVVNRLKQAGRVWEPPKRVIDLPGDEIEQLYLGGVSSEKLAEQFDCGSNTILRALQGRGVKIRTKTEHMRGWHAERNAKLATIDADKAALLAKLEELERGAERIRAEAKPKEPRRSPGARTKGKENQEYFKAGKMVEENVASGMELTAARRLVARAMDIQYPSVVRYHMKFRREGQQIPRR